MTDGFSVPVDSQTLLIGPLALEAGLWLCGASNVMLHFCAAGDTYARPYRRDCDTFPVHRGFIYGDEVGTIQAVAQRVLGSAA